MRVIREERRGWGSGWRFGSSKRWSDRLLALGVSLSLTAALACTAEAQPPPKPAPQPSEQTFQTIESPSMEFLPRLEEAAGWRMLGDPLVYPAANLAGYIGREARQYQAYEVMDLAVGEYERTDGEGRSTVEIYRFPDFVKAFGAYSERREAVQRFLEIENESFLGPHSVHIWRGPFYVRIVASGQGVVEPVQSLAAAVAERMPAAAGKPAVYDFFPTQNRILNSEGYSVGPVFGQPYLAGGFTVRFLVNEQPIDGVILPAPSKQVAEEVLGRWRTFFASNGRLLDPVPNLAEDNFVGEDRYQGRTSAFRLDRFVVAFRGFGETQQMVDLAIATDQRILNSIRQQLQAAERAARLGSQTPPARQ